MAKLVDYYDEEKWGESILSRDRVFQREKRSIGLIAQYAPKKAKILDIGCGMGHFLVELSKVEGNKYQLNGVDYSEYNVKKAKKLPFNFKRCNIEDGLPFKKGELDVIYAGELIEHLVDPDAFLEECNKSLKKNGYIVISTPNLVSWYNRIIFALGIQPIFYESSTRSPKIGAGPLKFIKQGKIPVGHIRIFTNRALKDLLVSQGFEIVKVKGANFDSLPKPMRIVDSVFNIYPRLASNQIVIAKKCR